MRRGVRRVAYRLPRERRGAPLVLQRRRAPRRVSRKPVHALLPPVRVAIRAQLALALALASRLAAPILRLRHAPRLAAAPSLAEPAAHAMRDVCLAQARHLPPIVSGGEIGRRAAACRVSPPPRARPPQLARRPGPPAEAARLDDVEPLPDVLLRPMRPPPRRPAAAPPAFMFRMVGTTPPSFPDPALSAPDSEARAARGTTTDSTPDPRA